MTVVKFTRYEAEKYLNAFISQIKPAALSGDVVYDLVKFKLELTKVVEGIEAFRKELIKTVPSPENLASLRADAQKEDATEEAKALLKSTEDNYNEELSKIAIPFFNEVVSVPFKGLSEEDFKEIVKAKELDSLFTYEYLYNKLVKVTEDDEDVNTAPNDDEAIGAELIEE
jgi:hypothetical protein